MASIDERVVSMAFDNKQFEAGVAQSMASLAALNQVIANLGKVQGVEDLQAAMDKINFGAAGESADKFEAKLDFDKGTESLGEVNEASKKISFREAIAQADGFSGKIGAAFSFIGRGVTALRAKLTFPGVGRAFGAITSAATAVSFGGLSAGLNVVKQKLNFGNKPKEAFSDIQRQSDRVNFSGFSTAVAVAGQSFSILEGAISVALGNIISKAAAAGAQMAKSLTITPISGGLKEYETNLNSIQTILANTQADGTNLKQVNAALLDLNNYSDKTIYNFSEMAKNIGTFTAAGVKLETATESIKGIANLAALSGSNSQQASTAMYQLSQAIAAGKVNLMDWNSVVNAGMGGQVFQKALFDTAKTMGTLVNVPVGQTFEEWKKAGNTFRNSLSETQKKAEDGTKVLKAAQQEAAESVRKAEESAAESIANAADRVQDAQKGIADAAKSGAEDVRNAQEGVKSALEASTEAQVNAKQRVLEAEAAKSQAAKQGAADNKAAAETVKMAQKSAAEAIEQAKDRVKAAQEAVADSAKQATDDIAAAVAAQKEAVKSSAEGVQAALDNVTEARKRLVEAMKPIDPNKLNAAEDALSTAKLDQTDTSDDVTEAQREQTRAVQDLGTAQEKLVEVMSSGTATAEEMQAAQRGVEDAQQRVTDGADAQERALLRQRAAARGVTEAQQALEEAQNAGAERQQNIVDAQDALTQATVKYGEAQVNAAAAVKESEENILAVRKASAENQKNASKNLTTAEKEEAEIRKAARKGVKQAEEDLKNTRLRSAEAQKAAGADLARAEQEQAKTVIDSNESVRRSQEALTEARVKAVENQRDAAEALSDAEQDQAKATRDARSSVAEAHEDAAKRIADAQASLKGDASTSAPTWLTSDVLTSTLAQFTGDLTDAQLAAKGFSKEQIEAIQLQAKTAEDSATKVKTISAVISTAREVAGSGWAQTWQLIFGDFGQAKSLFSGMSDALNGIIISSSKSRNELLKLWASLGGRDDLIMGLKNAFAALKAVLAPIRDAFREIFPPTTGQQLAELTEKFRLFTLSLVIGPETAEKLKRSFAGVFAVFHIGITVIKAVVGAIFDLLGAAGEGGGILSFTANIGDMLVALDKAISSGEGFKNFFEALPELFRAPLQLLGFIKDKLTGLFSDGEGEGASQFGESVSKLQQILEKAQPVIDFFAGVFETLWEAIKAIGRGIGTALGAAGNAITSFGEAMVNAFANLDFDRILATIQTGLIAGIVLMVKKFLDGGADFGSGEGFIEKISNILETLKDTLVQLQTAVRATVILEIAAAVALLAVGIVALSLIDGEDLAKSMAAIAGGMGMLVGAMVLLTKFAGTGGVATLPLIGAAMVFLAGAVDLLAIAVTIFSKLSLEELGRGLLGVGGVIAVLGRAISLLPPQTIVMGPALVQIAIAMNVLAIAVALFGNMDLTTIGKGLLGIGGSIAAIGWGLAFIPPENVARIAIALNLVALALNGIAIAMRIFAGMDLKEIGKGLLAMGGSLALIGLALDKMPRDAALRAAGVAIMAAALIGIASAVALFGNMKPETLAVGLGAMGLSLVILAAGLYAMEAGLPGAAALGLAALGLAALVPSIALLGTMDISTIVKGLAAMAATLVVIGVGGVAAGPGMIAIGLGLAAIGIGLLGISASIYIVARGMALLGENGQKGMATLIVAIGAFITLIPTMVISFIKGLVDILAGIALLAPKIAVSLAAILTTFADLLIQLQPKMAQLFMAILDTILMIITNKAPEIIEAGGKLLLALLKGIADYIPQIIPLMGRIITGFITGLANQLTDIINAGGNLIVKLLEGITNNLPKVVKAAADTVAAFLGSVARELPKVILAAGTLIAKFLYGISQEIPKVARAAVTMLVAFLTAVEEGGEKVIRTAVKLIGKFLDAAGQAMLDLTRKIAQVLINFLNGLADAIELYEPQILQAGARVAKAIIQGIVNGLGDLSHFATDAIGNVADGMLNKVKNVFGIHSPSVEMFGVGENVVKGLANGIGAYTPLATTAAGDMASSVTDAVNDELHDKLVFGGAAGMLLDFSQPVITPVVDLSNVNASGREILSKLGGAVPIAAASGYKGAVNIAQAEEDRLSAQASYDQARSESVFPQIKLEQNNYSPESLSAAEIYRQTSNQLSQAKSALGVAA